jgi:hypothetical protein
MELHFEVEDWRTDGVVGGHLLDGDVQNAQDLGIADGHVGMRAGAGNRGHAQADAQWEAARPGLRVQKDVADLGSAEKVLFVRLPWAILSASTDAQEAATVHEIARAGETAAPTSSDEENGAEPDVVRALAGIEGSSASFQEIPTAFQLVMLFPTGAVRNVGEGCGCLYADFAHSGVMTAVGLYFAQFQAVGTMRAAAAANVANCDRERHPMTSTRVAYFATEISNRSTGTAGYEQTALVHGPAVAVNDGWVATRDEIALVSAVAVSFAEFGV